ncbi:hypothetical protein CDO87_19100 [Sagittula sp. P11]|jgi:hypothetical protein|uniref:hypothetical protein n=1 Tax=Sagittula sp. P11 TaxID=2009329 RepID=UPI000C2D149D|nr:hypothetical protein [Sagittula sp. P11]AUC55142.1 hypothetical protein CDO87_19100 [Sagittula sp. P11]
MTVRSTRSAMTFSNPFTLPGYPDELPAGTYDTLVVEELLQGLSFEAYIRIATFLAVCGSGRHVGQRELRPTTEDDLEEVLSQDAAWTGTCSKAAMSPQGVGR